MAFPEDQLKFCGATIQSYRCSIGWADSASTLEVTLVESTNDGDVFVAPIIGSPVYFDYNGWKFGGLVQKWGRRRGSGGIMYDVTIVDPRDMLGGVQLILNGYTGSTYGVPNLYNVYGYLEQTYGYGSSGVGSQSGMPARLVAQAVAALISSSPIKYRGYNYTIDLTNLINIIPADLRVVDDNISLLDFMNYISTLTVSDSFIRMEYENFQNVIKPFFVSRANPPELNSINNFINTTQNTYGNVSNFVGREQVNEPTSKFLVGGNVNYIEYVLQNTEDLYLTGQTLLSKGDMIETYLYTDNTQELNLFFNEEDYVVQAIKNASNDANIWPFWGFDRDGNVILGEGPPSNRWSISGFIGNVDGVRPIYAPPQHIGKGFHKFTIDGRYFVEIYQNPALADYETDADEMYFALWGFETWIYYIFMSSITSTHHNFNFKNLNLSKAQLFQMIDLKNPLTLDELKNISRDKYILLPPDERANIPFFKWYLQKIQNYFSNVGENIFNTSAKAQLENDIAEWRDKDKQPFRDKVYDKLNYVYEYIKAYAEQYYGRKFMVKVPGIYAKRDVDTGDIVFNLKPAEGGYVTPEVEPFLASSGLIPYDRETVKLPDGRITAYVRFPINYRKEAAPIEANPNIVNDILRDGIWTNLNLSDLNEPIISWTQENPNEPKKSYVFVKCEIDPEPVFTDTENLSDPRFVITLEGKVSNVDKIENSPTYDILKNVLFSVFQDDYAGNEQFYLNKYSAMPLDNAQDLLDVVNGDIDSAIGELLGNIGVEDTYLQTEMGPMVMPDMVALTLENTLLTYGPWYTSGAEGITNFERNEDLVPWNYGGYTLMNTVAWSMVNDVYSTRQEVESGNVEFPGAPSFLLGDALEANGPVITNISVNVDPQAGVTTTYNMQTWSANFGEMQKKYIDKLVAVNNTLREQKRKIYELNTSKLKGNFNSLKFTAGRNQRTSNRKRHQKNSSTSPILMGQTFHQLDTDGNYTNTRSEVLISPDYYLQNQVITNYDNKAVMSLEGIFVPFTTESEVLPSSIAHYEYPETDAPSPNLHDLNPYGRPHNITILSQNVAPSSTDDFLTNRSIWDDNYICPTSVRALALKGPIMVAGYGYTTEGLPVPAKPDNPNEFIDDVGRKESEHKVGPLDIRWDDERKVWAAGGGANLYLGITKQNILAKSSGVVDIYDPSNPYPFNTELSYSGVYAYDFLLKNGDTLYSNTRVILAKIGKNYFIVNAECAGC